MRGQVEARIQVGPTTRQVPGRTRSLSPDSQNRARPCPFLAGQTQAAGSAASGRSAGGTRTSPSVSFRLRGLQAPPPLPPTSPASVLMTSGGGPEGNRSSVHPTVFPEWPPWAGLCAAHGLHREGSSVPACEHSVKAETQRV